MSARGGGRGRTGPGVGSGGGSAGGLWGQVTAGPEGSGGGGQAGRAVGRGGGRRGGRGPSLGEGPPLRQGLASREQRRGRLCFFSLARARAAPSWAPPRRSRSLCLRRPGERAPRPSGCGLRSGPASHPSGAGAPAGTEGWIRGSPAGPGPGAGSVPYSRAARAARLGARPLSPGAAAAAALQSQGDASRLVSRNPGRLGPCPPPAGLLSARETCSRSPSAAKLSARS